MATRTRKRSSVHLPQYDVETEWTAADLPVLEDLKKAEVLLPDDAPRALLSIRLSVLTDETTSPVRQELDLRKLALERGRRVVGVASDLNVSATKVPPWKRKELGDWLNNRAPEFDEILRRLRSAGVFARCHSEAPIALQVVSMPAISSSRTEPITCMSESG